MGTRAERRWHGTGGVIAGHPSHHAKLIENITMTAAIAVAFIRRLPRGTMPLPCSTPARVRIPDPSDAAIQCACLRALHRESVTVRHAGEQRTPRRTDPSPDAQAARMHRLLSALEARREWRRDKRY